MGHDSSPREAKKARAYAVAVPNSAKPGFSSVYRTPETVHGELTRTIPALDFNSFWSGTVRCAERFGVSPALGTRAVKADGTKGEYKWINFKELVARVLSVGSSLIEFELATEQTFAVPAGARYGGSFRFLGINAKNRQEWTVLDLACNAFGITSVPLYDTLGDDATEFIVKETRLVTVCADNFCVAHLLKMHQRLPIKRIICLDEITPEDQTKAEAAGVELFPYSKLLKPTKLLKPIEQKDDFVTTICYTSGTTGNPKGVVLTNSAFLATHAGAVDRKDMFKAGPGDVHISYLPMAHVYERMAQYFLLLRGAAVGYYSGDTLKLMDDAQALRPTIFLSVPRLYMRIVDKVQASVADKGCISQWLFSSAIGAKLHHYKTAHTAHHAIYDKIVFGKIQKLLGGRVRVMATGSAPLAKEVQQKVSCLFACNLLEGWGMTETCALTSCQGHFDCSKGTIGGIFGGMEYKLQSIVEMQYDAESRDHPRGELMVRGPVLFRGYFMNPEETNKTLDAEGWFSTGDVVEIASNGALSIIDRKKNIYKLAQGEYVAPEKIEGIYGQAALIGQIFAHGKSEKTCMVGVVVPDDEAVKRWAVKHSKRGTKLSEHIKDEDLKRDILLEMETIAKELFSVDNLMLTSTFKIIRHKAKQVFEKEIDELYAGLEQ
eukprot:GHVS01050815.1.p1 GENE.GHVS01050815.1~~GHVS01050815.1.p1  ORF type:complete len:661 (-),score=100.09 GHVS01050815.1:370-2352(-)